MNSLSDLSLDAVRALYASGVKPIELMTQLRSRAQEYADRNIFIHLLSDDELAPYIDALTQLDSKTAPLWGIPFVVKDNIDLAGIPTTAGCEAFSYTPSVTAQVVQRLIDQGALPLGKTNLDQFATGLNGTRSPWGACGNSFDPTLISGGSSAGSAVAVALGLATFSLGTDTAGSGRVPASFNNLVGLKPTRGLLSCSGVVPACRSLDCVSIFALHCDDANAVMAVAEGHDDSDGYSRQNPYDNRSHAYGTFSDSLTLGVIPESQLKFFGNRHYEATYRNLLDQLQAAGIELLDIDYAPFDEVARLLYEGPWVSERYIATLPLIEEQPQAIFPVVRDIITAGEKPAAVDLFRAQYRLSELSKRCHEQLCSIDALMTPTAGTVFTIEQMLSEPVRHNSELGYYMNFVNLLDLAAVAVPTAMTAQGLPFGVTLSAAAFSDRHLLAIANRLQQIGNTPLGAGKSPLPPLSNNPVSRNDWMELVVCGAHMQNMPLNHQLTERGAEFVQQTQTAAAYQFFALTDTGSSATSSSAISSASSVQRPALIRNEQSGAAIEVEVWRMPSREIGSFLSGIAPPLGLGKVQLTDNRWVCGFIAEACAMNSGVEISEMGSWRSYLARS